MPPAPTLRLRATPAAMASQGSQVEHATLQPLARPSRQPAVLRLKPVTQEARLEAFAYHSKTTAVVTESDGFTEVSDGPPGSGLCQGERRANDGTWSEQFIQQTGVRGGPGQGKGHKGKGKGKGSSSSTKDFGQRKGRNDKLGQRWKEAWERNDEEAGVVRLHVERHVQQVDDLDAAEVDVLQEWDETEEWEEPTTTSGGASSSSSCASASAAATTPQDGQVLMSRTTTQTGRDRRSGRTWKRVLTRRRVQREEEVVSESDEDLVETETNGDSRGNTRHRVGQSVETSEWGDERGGSNRWRSNYSLQTLINNRGEIVGREWVRKWYNNGEEEQSEEWETLDDFERIPGSSSNLRRENLRLRNRIRSGRKDGRKFTGDETEWHERWEEQEEPDHGQLRLRRKKIEKWWRENAHGNAWGDHQIEDFDTLGGSTGVQRRNWYDNGTERQDEHWTEHPDGSANGTKEGSRGSQKWGETWRRTCTGEDGNITVEKWHDDGLGTKVDHKEVRRWEQSKDVEWHHEEIGEVVGQSENWVVKVGRNACGDEWFEAWKTKQAEKSSEKAGKNARGDAWREAWVEEFDASGVRVKQRAEKEGSNAQGDSWYEEWIEEQEKKKQALKRGSTASGAEWKEEWGEEAREDGSGFKWTSKWADDGSGNRWGDSWGDEWGGDGDGGKRWVEKWDNHGKNEKHSHDTDGRPEH